MNMQTYAALLAQFRGSQAGSGLKHATLAGHPARTGELRQSVESLVHQVDSLHVFLEGFSSIPEFLAHEKVFVTLSQDIGSLGECGKYYWVSDLPGFHFICSDRLIYPADYIETMTGHLQASDMKGIIACGGWTIRRPFISAEESLIFLEETLETPRDWNAGLLSDRAVAFHSSAFKLSRHHFYQPELSSDWLTIAALEQGASWSVVAHPAGWLRKSGEDQKPDLPVPDLYRSLLIRSYFTSDDEELPTASWDFNDYFDRAYVMNLDRRPDRWERICRIAGRHGLNLTRFPAVDGSADEVRQEWERYAAAGLVQLPEGIDPLTDYRDKFLKYHHYIARIHFMESKLNRKAVQTTGALGYALSYISILREAISNNYRRIMIFDDDILLHKSFREEFARYARELPPDWKLIMLGAMQHRWEPYITPVKGLFYHCHGSSVASHAVGIDRKVFLQLLYYAEKKDLPIDEGAIFHIQNVYDRQCLIFLPNLAIQDMSESDISSSAMKQEETASWMARFRWNPPDYDDLQ